MSESMNQKIAKLLRLAERAGTPEEAETASRMAERLMLKWGIDEAMIRSTSDQPEVVITKTVPFPKQFVKARTGIAHSVIRGMGNMRSYNVSNGGTIARIAIMGFTSDVERAETLIASIVLQADHALAHWWKTAPERSWMTSAQAFKAKRQFLVSFGAEVEKRLVSMRTEEINKGEPGTAIVLRDRQAIVDGEYDKVSLRRGRGFKGSFAGASEGRAAGSRARLGGQSLGGSRRAIGG